jgi:AcrR family transcriptional regulator
MKSREGSGRDSYHHGDLRRALVERGLALLAREGPAGFSLRALAQELGVSHAAPYRHFASRKELLSAIVAESRERFTEALRASIAGPGEAGDKIYLLGEAYVRFYLENPAILYLFSFLPGQLAAEGETLGEIFLRDKTRGEDESFGLLRSTVAGLVEGFPELSERDVLLGYWAKAHGLATLLVSMPDYFGDEDLRAGISRVIRQAF